MIDYYPGSKGGDGVWQRIISQMPPHQLYVEPFLGTGFVLRKKRPAAINIGVDADPKIIQLHKGIAQDGVARGRWLFICGDAISLMEQSAWQPEDLIYCDPPYLMETRSCKRRYYRCELDRAGHTRMLDVLKALPCMVILSGYPSDLYSNALTGWRTVQIPTVNRRGQKVIEWLWLNFPQPAQLHDDRFVGKDFRERERIKKKKTRWVTKLSKMPALERSVLMAALHELVTPAPATPPGLSRGSGTPAPIASYGVGGRVSKTG